MSGLSNVTGLIPTVEYSKMEFIKEIWRNLLISSIFVFCVLYASQVEVQLQEQVHVEVQVQASDIAQHDICLKSIFGMER